MNITDTFQTRLKQAMIKTGMRQIEVCRLTGISQSLLNKYLKYFPSNRYINKSGFRANWFKRLIDLLTKTKFFFE